MASKTANFFESGLITMSGVRARLLGEKAVSGELPPVQIPYDPTPPRDFFEEAQSSSWITQARALGGGLQCRALSGS